MTLKELRTAKGLTQSAAAKYLGISLRAYQYYETDVKKQTGIRFDYLMERMRRYGYRDETTGMLTVEQIRQICAAVLPKYRVHYCYLFGSYAKGTAKEESDVDLLISTESDGLNFFELAEELRETLKKKVDLLEKRQLANNLPLTNEILQDGIKIYG